MRKILYLLYQIFIFLPIFLLATIITAVMVMVGCTVGDKKRWGYVPPRYWSKLACRLALCKVTVTQHVELDPEQSYVIVANHQGVFDIFLMYGYMGENIKWVQKHTLRKLPLVGKASEIAGHVFINQSSLKSMGETIQNAKNELEVGASMAIFPEGARTFTGQMDRFRKGAFVIAREMGLPVLPVTVNGPYDVMKIHTYLIHPSPMELVIHEPINTKGMSDDGITELMKKCQEVVYSGLWEKYK